MSQQSFNPELLTLLDPREEMDDDALDRASRNAFPVVAGTSVRRDRAGLALGLVVALGLGAVTFTSLSTSQPKPASPRNAAQPPAPDSTQAATAAPARQPLAEPMAPAPIMVPPPTAAQQAVLSAPPGTADMAIRPGSAPVMVFDGSLVDLVPTPRGAQVAATGPAASAPAGLNENEMFGSRLGGSDVETASASRIADPANTVTQGTLIPAVLETAIDSDLPGYVRAVVSLDVKSFDGKQVLIPRSTRLIGQYKSGLAAGQTRAYVMWTRLIRPDGVTVALASPAIEYSGRSGLSGEVDGHFFKRFGSASLLSVIGGLGALASGGAGLIIAGGGTSAASVAAQRDAQIPPTVRVAIGQPVRVFTARDLDFSTVAP